jgi:hypothetical protein
LLLLGYDQDTARIPLGYYSDTTSYYSDNFYYDQDTLYVGRDNFAYDQDTCNFAGILPKYRRLPSWKGNV